MRPVKIVHLYPELLNLYGDGGNIICLKKRLEWRGIPVALETIRYGDAIKLSDADIVFMGGGPDREQRLATEQLLARRDELASYVEDDGVLLAICGGYQLLGREWLMGDDCVEGLAIVGLTTQRVSRKPARLIDNIVLRSPLARRPVVGYENHAGRTFLDAGLEPFGQVISSVGWGNNDDDKSDGVLYRNLIGTYLHGPLLGKNPEIADCLLARALERRAQKEGTEFSGLKPLDDAEEHAANDYMSSRLGCA